MPAIQIKAAGRCPQRDSERASKILRLYAPLGGVASDHEMVERLRGGCSQPISTLARWIVSGDVFHFRWQSRICLPLFQFGCGEGGTQGESPVRGMRRLLNEFGDVFDELDVAEWLATPNTWLFATAPATLVTLNIELVVQAARTDRFIARGWC